jgi:hypothetical protein
MVVAVLEQCVGPSRWGLAHRTGDALLCTWLSRRGYFESLPEREYLPMFWSAGELARLAGTGVAERARDDAALAAEDFHAHVPPLCAAHPGRLPARRMTLEAFRTAASWVASRAFGVDSYHGVRSSLDVWVSAERCAAPPHMHPVCRLLIM